MALKRKFEVEVDDAMPTNVKQLKLIPFPNFEGDSDVVMSEAEPLYIEPYHTRLVSNASSISSDTSDSPSTGSPPYPTFDLYSLPSSPNLSYPPSPPVGLLQPSSSFVHHGSNCSQIPKLRIACASGLNGHRTMWSFCEQCGAISMVDSD